MRHLISSIHKALLIFFIYSILPCLVFGQKISFSSSNSVIIDTNLSVFFSDYPNFNNFYLETSNNPSFLAKTVYSLSNSSITLTINSKKFHYFRLKKDGITKDSTKLRYFNPLEFDSIEVYIKPDSWIDFYSGSLPYIDNLSSNNEISQADSTKIPTIQKSKYGFNGLKFDGVNDQILFDSLKHLSTEYSIFCFYTRENNEIFFSNINTLGYMILQKFHSSGGTYLSFNGSVNPPSGFFMEGIEKDSNKVFRYENGSRVNSINNFPINKKFHYDRLGGYNSTIYDGVIVELIAIKSSIGLLYQDTLYNYIKQKYQPDIFLGNRVQILEYSLCPKKIKSIHNFSYDSIYWSNGETIDSVYINSPQTISVTAISLFGNTSYDTIQIIDNRPNLYQPSSQNICFNTPFSWPTQMPHTYNFLWQDGSTDSVLTISQPGNYWVQVTDSFGCSITSDTVHIEVDSFAVQASLGPDKSLCQGNQLELETGRGDAVNYLWNTGDSTSSITINNAGQFSVTATNNLGCIAEDTINIGIKGLAPTPLFSFHNVCFGDSAYFLDSSLANSGTFNQWIWNFGDGNADSIQHPTHLFLDSGKYEVTLTVVTDSGCEASARDTVLIYPNPMADFNFGLSCSNLTTQFYSNSNSPWDSIVNWLYTFGNGNTSNLANPLNTFSSSQNYNPKLIVENSFGCKDSISKPLFVKPSPIADFNYSSPCINDSVLIQQNAAGVGSFNYQWTLWNGFAFSGNSFSNVFASNGSFPLSLQVTDTNNCFDTITKSIPIRNHPQILNQLNDTIICLFDALTWNVPYPKNHFSFLWQDGSSDSLFHIDSAGIYFYQVTDSVGCSSTSQSIQISVNNFPSLVTLGNDASLCKGELVSIKNNPVYLTQILWNTGDTSTTIAIDSTSNYSVTLTDTMGCVGVDTFNVLVRGEAALAKMAFDTTCILDSTQFFDVSILASGDTIINWEWEFGNNLLDSIQNPKTYYPASGFYPIHLKTLTNDFCFSETFDTIQVYNLPSPSFSSPLACDNRELIFTDNSTAGDGIISNWNWSFGDANNTKSNLQNPVFTYDTSGNFSVSLEVINSFGCFNLTAQNKKVEFTPRAKFETNNVCEGEIAQFTSTSFIGVSSFYVWDFGDSIQSQGLKVQHLYDSINSYQVQLIVNSQNGCSDTAFSVLEVFQNPEAKTFTGKFCKNETFAIEDTSSTLPYPISKYTWKLNNVEIDTGKFLNFSLNDTGSYDFELIITNSVGCSDSTVGAIKIDDFPIANFDYAPTFGAAPILVDFFNQSSQFFNNVWKMNDSTFSTNREAEFNFEQNGNYNIKLINTNATGCADSITKTIKILPPILDISISNLSYEVVENSFLKSSFEVSNLGTRTINYFEILAETQSGQKLKEIFELTIQPGETVQLSLNSQLQLPENNQFGYLCLEASNPENEGIDNNPLNNKVCLSQESFVVQNIFPNPSSNNVNIGFIVGEIDQVTVEIFNSNGEEIKLLYSGNTVIGLNTFILSVENLDASLYVARYTFKGEQKTQNFVVTK